MRTSTRIRSGAVSATAVSSAACVARRRPRRRDRPPSSRSPRVFPEAAPNPRPELRARQLGAALVGPPVCWFASVPSTAARRSARPARPSAFGGSTPPIPSSSTSMRTTLAWRTTRTCTRVAWLMFFGHVRRCLGDHEVGGVLDGSRYTATAFSWQRHVQIRLHRAPRSHGGEGSREAAVGQNGWGDPRDRARNSANASAVCVRAAASRLRAACGSTSSRCSAAERDPSRGG